MKIEPTYKIGSRVYSVLPDSPVGIVINITYSYLTKLIQYQVSFDAIRDSMWYFEHELSETKTF